ncbi:group III truncated hemoglobin [Pseudoblastomonas halimionae]|uniref:Globin n=1 Tax=Alteriqipengyuania halimionae TaxID=1926630 RepID=A0A6I4U457_9SPHN|nr:group III truncated hemoglobin [Alteriqipengyuania halimionae]MXP09693.1 hypothetical protein [Alteriqipengyuania halimionae]
MSPIRERTRSEVRQAREAKRAHAASLGVDEAFVDHMVETFYGVVRDDDLLGPIFAERIEDWPAHLARMKGFWRSILFNSGEFSGNPMQKHMAIPGLGQRHFSRWLALFYDTLRTLERDPEGTSLVAARARSIADSLLTGIAVRRDGLSGSNAGKDLPHA